MNILSALAGGIGTTLAITAGAFVLAQSWQCRWSSSDAPSSSHLECWRLALSKE